MINILMHAGLAVFTAKNPIDQLQLSAVLCYGPIHLSLICRRLASTSVKLQRVGRIGICVEQKLISSYLGLIVLITFRVSRIDDTKCIVVTRVCVSVRGRMPTVLHGPGCNFGECYGMPRSCALLGGFTIDARVALLWQHNAKY